jgi:hypothetical protein
MTYRPDNIDADIDVISLLQAILVELKKLNLMMAEATEQKVRNEDVS